MTTPNLADALRGLLDAGWELIQRRQSSGEYALVASRRSPDRIWFLEGPDPAQLVLDLWSEVLGE